MAVADARIPRWDARVTAGQTVELSQRWYDQTANAPVDLSVSEVRLWLGGTTIDGVDDLTGAAEVVPTISGEYATFTWVAGFEPRVLRTTFDDRVVTVGRERPSNGARAANSGDAAIFINDGATVCAVSVHIDAPGGGGGFIGAFTTAAAPPAENVPTGHYYFDTTIGAPFWSNGVEWIGSGEVAGPTTPTGATAGSPGEFTPEGASVPANLADLQSAGITPSPETAWTAGQHVVLGDTSTAYWDSSAWVAGTAPAPLTVAFSAVPGETFAPKIGLSGSTTITWRNSNGDTLDTGDEPSFTVPLDGDIEMDVADSEAVEYLNFGFNNTQDAGAVSLPADYNWTPTSLTGVTTSMVELPNLKYFMAADTDLTGHLDFGGCTALEYIECFHAHVESADITGCTGIIRICFETCALSHVDLTPTRLTLRDLRAADQTGPPPMVVECDGDLTVLYHYCVQGNVSANLVPVSQMPTLREWWAWDRAETSIDEEDLPVSRELRSLRLDGNPFDATTVGLLLERLANLGFTATSSVAELSYNGSIIGDEFAAAPEAVAGARALLLSRGWSLNIGTPAGDPTSDGVWPGNSKDGTATGWSRLGSAIPLAVYGDKLTGAWTGYNRIMRATPDAGSNDNIRYEVTADRTSFNGTFWGMFCRASGTGTSGARAIINGTTGAVTGIGICDTVSGGNATITTLASVPAGWTNAGEHSMAMEVSGLQVTVYLDDVACYRATPAPSGGVWGGYYFGFCGSPSYVSRSWNDFDLAAL